jgi:hypothetical protein
VLKEILEQENLPDFVKFTRNGVKFHKYTKKELEKIANAWMLIEIERKLDGKEKAS